MELIDFSFPLPELPMAMVMPASSQEDSITTVGSGLEKIANLILQANGYNQKSLNDQLAILPENQALIESFLEKFKTAVDDYGCWCYFEGQDKQMSIDRLWRPDYSYGGPALDKLDGLCRNLQNSYDCGRIDFDLESSKAPSPRIQVGEGDELEFEEKMEPLAESCDPINTSFRHNFTPKMENFQILQQCQNLNKGNPCSIITCQAEGIFIFDLLRFNDFRFDNISEEIYKLELADVKNKRSNRKFDIDSQCIVHRGDHHTRKENGLQLLSHILNLEERFPKVGSDAREYQHSEKRCCGSEAYRFPYNPLKQKCCQDKIYNPLLFDCCEGNKLDISC